MLYGGKNANPANVTPGGNLGATMVYDRIVTIGKIVLRAGVATRLQDIPCVMVTIFNAEGNGSVWYGGIADQTPQVGAGTPIPEGTPKDIVCTDSNLISLIPENDGDEIYVIVYASGQNVPITPNNPPSLDTTPPTLLAIVPGDGDTAVSISQPIVIQASEPIDSSSIIPNNIQITPIPTNYPIVTFDTGNPVNILIYPFDVANLTGGTHYTISISNIADLAGNLMTAPYSFSFDTTNTADAADTSSPTIISSMPAQNSSSASPSSQPTILFSEPMDINSFTPSNVMAFATVNNQQFTDLSFNLSVDMKTLSIANMSMIQSATYEITVIGGSTGPKDLAGNYIVSNYQIPFITSAPPGPTSYNVSGNNYDTLQGTTGYTETCIYMNDTKSVLITQKPVSYTFIVKKFGSPTGTVDIIWQRNSIAGFTDFRTIGSIDIASVTTADQTFTIDDSGNTEPLKYQDIISLRYTGGNINNYILVKISNYDAIDGAKTCNLKRDYKGNRNIFSSIDLAGTITFAGSS
jgi:hypothetical protein